MFDTLCKQRDEHFSSPEIRISPYQVCNSVFSADQLPVPAGRSAAFLEKLSHVRALKYLFRLQLSVFRDLSQVDRSKGRWMHKVCSAAAFVRG